MGWFNQNQRGGNNIQREIAYLVGRVTSGSVTPEEAERLATYGPACVEPLVRMSGAEYAKSTVFRLVGLSAHAPLVALLHDNDPGVRRAAAGGLGCLDFNSNNQLRDETTELLLYAMMDEELSSPFEQMGQSLAALQDKRAAYPLQVMAQKYKPEFGKHAAYAVSLLLKNDGVSLFSDHEYRPGEGLVRKPQSDQLEKSMWVYTRDMIRQRNIHLLAGFLEGHDWETKTTFLLLYDTKFIDPGLVDPILGCLLHPEYWRYAVEAMEQYKDTRAIPALIWLHKYCDATPVSFKALSLIGALAVRPIVEAMEQLDRHLNWRASGPWIRWRTKVWELNKRGGWPAVETIKNGLLNLSAALGEVSDPAAKSQLLQLTHHPLEYVRKGAEAALRKLP